MSYSLCTYVYTRVLFNHRTWMVCDWHFVRIPAESNEITLTMTSQYWSFHVVATVKQYYFSKAVTYSERYSICTYVMQYSTLNTVKNLHPVLFYYKICTVYFSTALGTSVRRYRNKSIRLLWKIQYNNIWVILVEDIYYTKDLTSIPATWKPLSAPSGRYLLYRMYFSYSGKLFGITNPCRWYPVHLFPSSR